MYPFRGFPQPIPQTATFSLQSTNTSKKKRDAKKHRNFSFPIEKNHRRHFFFATLDLPQTNPRSGHVKSQPLRRWQESQWDLMGCTLGPSHRPGRIGWEVSSLTYSTDQHTGVSKDRGAPKSSILIGVSIINYKPSILGSPYFWKHPCRSKEKKVVPH